MTSTMRGLSVFISDIRNCQNKELERLRVDKELGHIRTRFKNEKGLTPYEKKKYVWKMLYIYMLGYDVDFGHMEAVSLISAPKYPEKQMDEVINQAQATRSALGTQRAFFGQVQGKVKQLGDNFPKIRGLLGAIRRKRSKDTLILSAVIAACTLFLIIYWLSK